MESTMWYLEGHCFPFMFLIGQTQFPVPLEEKIEEESLLFHCVHSTMKFKSETETVRNTKHNLKLILNLTMMRRDSRSHYLILFWGFLSGQSGFRYLSFISIFLPHFKLLKNIIIRAAQYIENCIEYCWTTYLANRMEPSCPGWPPPMAVLLAEVLNCRLLAQVSEQSKMSAWWLKGKEGQKMSLGSIRILEKLYCHATKLVYGQYIMCSDYWCALMWLRVFQSGNDKPTNIWWHMLKSP